MSRGELHLWPRPITEPISKDNVPASLQSYALNMSFPIEPFLYVLSHLISLSISLSLPFFFSAFPSAAIFENVEEQTKS